MGVIRILAPPGSGYFFGVITVLDMAGERILGRIRPGEELAIPTEGAIDLGVAWGQFGVPTAQLRFMAEPGQTYRLRWLTRGFGAGIGVQEL